MNSNDQELEVKFLVLGLKALEQKLKNLGASLVSPRTIEANLRFDYGNGSLSKNGKVLRLRHDAHNVMTFKGPSSDQEGVTSRQEIEFKVSNFAAARRLLEALGFQVTVAYEKYRSTYAIDGIEVMLDEMPYGDFCEIEGADPAQIQALADKLGLKWATRSMSSYMVLFETVKKQRRLAFRDLYFKNFKGLVINPDDLGLIPADLG
jgi:adenylate cyclase, class 2